MPTHCLLIKMWRGGQSPLSSNSFKWRQPSRINLKRELFHLGKFIKQTRWVVAGWFCIFHRNDWTHLNWLVFFQECLWIHHWVILQYVHPLFFCGHGARLRGSKSYAINLILRLFLYHFVLTMSLWRNESIHNNTNNQQTPPPWWWSRSPLQQHGFDKSTLSEWRAALRIYFPRLLLKGLVQFNKLM